MSRSSSPHNEHLSYEERLAAFMDDDEEDESQGMRKSSQSVLESLPNGHTHVAHTNGSAALDLNGSTGLEEDEEEEFFYSGTDRRKQLFEDGEESSDAEMEKDKEAEGGVTAMDSYADRLKEALGSDDEDLSDMSGGKGDAGEGLVASEDEEAFTYPGSSRQPNAADDSVVLPDITVDSVAADSFASRHSQRARPLGYPTLSRLRAAGLGLIPQQEEEAGPSRPLSFRQSSVGTLSSSTMARTPDEAGISSLRGVSSSASSITPGSSLTGRKRRRVAFPYGPSSTEPSHTIPPLAEAGNESRLQRSLQSSAVAGSPLGTNASSGALPQLVRSAQADLPPFRWSAIRKLSAHLATAPNTSKQPTSKPELRPALVLAVGGGLVAVGRADGTVVVHGHPNGEQTFLDDEQAHSTGSVTALAVSSDHTYIAVGHESGHIMLYDLARPKSPARHVSPVEAGDVRSGRKEGHLVKSRILHLSFVGTRHTAIVSADDQGLAFYHSLGKILGVSSNDTLRILGRYPDPRATRPSRGGSLGAPETTRSTVLGMSALPLGPVSHFTDQFSFVALVTASKLVVVSVKPTARTWYRRTAPAKGISEVGQDLGPPEQAGLHSLGAISVPETAAIGSRQGDAEVASTDAAEALAGETKPEIAPLMSKQNSLAGMVAWYPAIEANQGALLGGAASLDPLLAHSFGNQLFVTALSTARMPIKTPPSTADTNGASGYKTDLRFEEEIAYIHDKTITALQWLSREYLYLLDISGELHLFSLARRRCTASERLADSIPPLVLHDFRLPAQAISEAVGLPLAPSAAQSVKSYKGQIFILTTRDVVAGTALSWADHVLSYVSRGDFLGAVDLATAFYTGAKGESALGLPDDVHARQSVVGSKLRELMRASVQYAFSPERLTDATHVTADGRGVDRTEQFQQLAASCAEACSAINDLDLLFGDIHDAYADNGIESIFAEQLELFIVTGRIRVLPITVVQRLIAFRQRREEYDLAERIIWHVDPTCLDLDQALSLCLQQRLWDALIYVYNSAMDDYVAPVVELLGVVKRAQADAHKGVHESTLTADDEDEDDAYKIFSYLSVVLTGRAYPSQEPLQESQSVLAKTALYSFLFSGRCQAWPPGPGGQIVFTQEGQLEPTYPYLRLLLNFDAEAFLDALDVAFEDAFLDADEDDDATIARSGDAVSRQMLVSILLEIFDADHQVESRSPPTQALSAHGGVESRLSDDAITFCCLFVARNAPKYPQFIQLRPSQVMRLLTTLSTDTDQQTREDRQLGVECLLSSYKVDQDDAMLSLFEQAGFFRVLQTAYRGAGRWDKLITMLLRDSSAGSEMFEHLSDVLSNAASSGGRAGLDDTLQQLLIDAVQQLATVDPSRTAYLVDRFGYQRHAEALAAINSDQAGQLAYLQAFGGLAYSTEEVAPNAAEPLDASHLDQDTRHLFVSLVAELEPDVLVRSLTLQSPEYFDARRIIDISEEHECYDAVFWALARSGAWREAFQALDRFVAMETPVLRASDATEDDDVLSPLALGSAAKLRRLVDQVVDFCKQTNGDSPRQSSISEDINAQDAWFQLLQSLVALMHGVASAGAEPSKSHPNAAMQFCRDLVRDALASLVSSTSADAISFPSLFRKLALESDETAGSDGPSGRMYAEVRTVLKGMLDAYQLRIELLGITNRLFDRDIFTNLSRLTRQRRRGWRPNAMSQTCTRCGGSLFGDEDKSNTRSGTDSIAQNAEAATPSLTRMRRKSSVPNLDTIPSRPASPLLHPTVSPRPDKGKGVARPLGDDEPGGYFTGHLAGNGYALPSFGNASRSMSVSSMATDPSESFSALNTPRLGFSDEDERHRMPTSMMDESLDIDMVSRLDRSRRLSTPKWTNGFESASSGPLRREGNSTRAWEGELGDAEEVDKAVVILRTGEAWHRRCAPFAR